jgi:hypothetical protein
LDDREATALFYGAGEGGIPVFYSCPDQLGSHQPVGLKKKKWCGRNVQLISEHPSCVEVKNEKGVCTLPNIFVVWWWLYAHGGY